MSIKAYVGRMGSGKTYEVVSVVILNALARGRRVVSNIAGLDKSAFDQLIQAQGIQPEHVGELVFVDHETVLQPNFWRTDKDHDQGIEAFIQPGDLLALDEIWRFWDGFADRKQPDRVMNFFRMHRHFSHEETGVTCDVVLITQDVMDISRRVRAVIEETYRMEKLTAVGMAKRYRVDIFQGGKISRNPLRQIQRTYDAKFFPLYSSHSQQKEGGADAKEENIDKRGNIFGSALFRVVLPLGLVVMVASVWFVFRTLSPSSKSELKPDSVAAADKKSEPSRTDKSSSVDKQKSDIDTSDKWRVSGYYSSSGAFNVVVLESGNFRVLSNPPSYKLTNVSLETFLPSGEAVTSWTGQSKKSALPPPAP